MEENKTTAETIPTQRPDSSMNFDQSTVRPKNKIYDEFLISNISSVGRIFTSLGATNAVSKNKNNRNKNGQPVVQPTMTKFNLASNSNYIDTSVRASPITPGQLKKLPNQVSSLFLSQSPAIKNDWQSYEKQGIDFASNNQTDLMFLYNYSTLFQIEFKDGYKKDPNGRPLLNQPIWKPITEKELARVENNEIILCRIEKYENLEIGLTHPDILDLPIIDKYFFLAKNSTTLSKARTAPPKKRKKKPSQQLALEKANRVVDFEAAIYSKGITRSGD